MNKAREVGITTEEVGERLKKMNEILEANDMTLGAEQGYNVRLAPGRKDTIISATVTVYFFAKDE